MYQQGQASTGVSSGERAPTTSTTVGGSSESAVSVVQRPLSTRASSAATKSRALLAQGSKRSSPRVPLLQLPPPPREIVRPSPSRRKEHGFTIGRGRSPSIESDYDEDDGAWWDSIVEESKESLAAFPAVTSNENNQGVELSGEASGSNAGTTGAPQGDHRVTSSSSSMVELSGEASGSNTGTTGAPQGDHRVTMSTSTPMSVENVPPARKRTTGGRLQQLKESRRELSRSQSTAREDELDSLRSELSKTQLHATQLQQLLEEDAESHPSNKQARADRAELAKVRNELSELRSTHWITNREFENANDINDRSIVDYLALT